MSLFLGLLLFGCQSAVPLEEVVYEDRHGWVGIHPFSYFVQLICHPIRIAEWEIANVLAGLRIQEFPSSDLALPDSQMTQPVFTEKQIAYLAPKIKQSLIQAIEEDYVLFRIYDDQAGRRYKTEGIFYVSEVAYHITLTHYRVPVNAGSLPPQGSPPANNWQVLFHPQQAILPEEQLYQFFVYEPDFHLGLIHLNPSAIWQMSS